MEATGVFETVFVSGAMTLASVGALVAGALDVVLVTGAVVLGGATGAVVAGALDAVLVTGAVVLGGATGAVAFVVGAIVGEPLPLAGGADLLTEVVGVEGWVAVVAGWVADEVVALDEALGVETGFTALVAGALAELAGVLAWLAAVLA